MVGAEVGGWIAVAVVIVVVALFDAIGGVIAVLEDVEVDADTEAEESAAATTEEGMLEKGSAVLGFVALEFDRRDEKRLEGLFEESLDREPSSVDDSEDAVTVVLLTEGANG